MPIEWGAPSPARGPGQGGTVRETGSATVSCSVGPGQCAQIVILLATGSDQSEPYDLEASTRPDALRS